MFIIDKVEETDIGRRCGACKSEENLRVLKIKEAGIQNNFISIVLCQKCLKELSDKISEDLEK
jgi:hypothetical protein